MANNNKENKIEKFTKEAIGKTLNQFNKEIGIADLVEINKNQDRILNGILSQVNDESTEKTEKSNIITLDNSTDGIVELKEIQGDTNINVSKIEEMPITHDIGEKEGNVFTLNEIPKGAISIGEIQGNTMVNCNKDDKKELVLMKDLSTQGDNNITLTEGVDGGKVDVALEGNTLVNVSKTKDNYITHEREEDTTGNHIALADEGYIRPVLNGKTMVNVCDRKDPIAVTKSYTVENSGNHVALQGDVDGSCRPVITGNTLVNLASNSNLWEVGCSGDVNTDYTITSTDDQGIVVNKLTDNVDYFYLRKKIDIGLFKPSTTYTIIFNSSKAYRVGIVSGNTAETALPLLPCNDGYNTIIVTSTDFSTVTGTAHIYAYLSIDKQYIGTAKVSDFIVLEGDYSNKPIPDYFTGLQSSFEDRVVPENINNVSLWKRLSVNTPNVRWQLDGELLSSTKKTLYNGSDKIIYFEMNSDIQGIHGTWLSMTPLLPGEVKLLNTPLLRTLQLRDNDGWNGTLDLTGIYLIEGDYTNYDFSDYNPTKAGKYKVDYKVTGKNKSHLEKEDYFRAYGSGDFISNSNYNSFISEVSPNTQYIISFIASEQGKISNFCFFDKYMNYISGLANIYNTDTTKQVITPSNCRFVTYAVAKDVENHQLEEGSTATAYEPYKEYTKTLYLNSPLLEGDTIEQYGNNIVYVHRYGKVVLNGSESWQNSNNNYAFVTLNRLGAKASGKLFCDTLMSGSALSGDMFIGTVGLGIHYNDTNRTNLTTLLSWLQSNPVTVVYELASPQYEVISTNDKLLVDSYVNGHLDFESAVPVEKVVFNTANFNNKYLYNNTEYIVQFESDNIGKIYFLALGLNDSEALVSENVVKGINKFKVSTSDKNSNYFYLDGIGFNASNIVVTPAIEQDFDYFSGLSSTFEDGLVTQEMVDNGEEEVGNLGKYRVDYKVTGKNKFDINLINPQYAELTSTGFIVRKTTKWSGVGIAHFKLKKHTDYIFNFKVLVKSGKANFTIRDNATNTEIKGISTILPSTEWVEKKLTWNSGNRDKIILYFYSNFSSSTIDEADVEFKDIQIEEGTETTSYEPYKESTKTLYLNSPLLEGDAIEEKNGGIYHVHNDNKATYDGSDDEGWILNTVYDDGGAQFVRVINTSKKPSSMKVICDKLPYKGELNKGADGIWIFNTQNLVINSSSIQDINTFKAWLQSNPLTVVYKLKTPKYELIEQQSSLAIPSYANGHLDLTSAVPVSKVNFLHFEEELTYLYPSTSYTVQFVSDKAITIDITLGGTSLLAQSIVAGLNRISITTPSELADNKLVISGVGASISNVVVTDTDKEFKYFEGMKSVGEGNGIEILSQSNLAYIKDNNQDDTTQINFDVANIKAGTTYTIYIEGEVSKGFNLLNGYWRDEWTFIKAEKLKAGCYSNLYVLKPKYDGILRFNGYSTVSITSIMLVEGEYTAETMPSYIPHQSNTQQLTHEPLRAVGDVKDRYVLIDGKWYIERRCIEYSSEYLMSRCFLEDNNPQYNTVRIGFDNLHSTKKPQGNKCDKYKTKSFWNADEEGVWVDHNFKLSLSRTKATDLDGAKEYLRNNPFNIVCENPKPVYEEINYNPLEVYSDVTHITTNSAIPTNIAIKNHGYNCLLKPSTTYTVSSNLGLNTVTTGADIGDSCLRFYNEDTSNVTTMKDVLLLEGDWTSKADLIPSNFSGIKSCFEQALVTDETDVNYGKYKVTARVVGKNLFDKEDNWIKGQYLDAYDIIKFNDGAYYNPKYLKVNPNETYYSIHKDGTPMNISYLNFYDKNKNFIKMINDTTQFTIPSNVYYIRVTIWINNIGDNEVIGENFIGNSTTYEPYKESDVTFYIDEPLRGVEDSKDKVFIQDDKVVVQRNCGTLVLDGIESWIYMNNFPSKIYAVPFTSNIIENSSIMCDKIIPRIYSISAKNYWAIFYSANHLRIQTPISTVDEFKQWLQQNPVTVVYQLAEPVYEEVEYSSNRLILDTFNNESFNNSTLFLDTNISPKLSFKPLYEELVYVKNSTKYYIQFNAVGSGEVVINLGGTELTTEIVEEYNCIPITTPSESTNLMTISGQGITISEVIVSEVVCGGYYKGLQSCFEEHMENGKYRVLLRGIALDGSKVNGIKLYINEPLRGVGDTKDRLCIKNGKLMVERKCASVTFDGSDDEDVQSLSRDDEFTSFILSSSKVATPVGEHTRVICDILPSDRTQHYYTCKTPNIYGWFDDSADFVGVLKGNDVNVRQWLQQNPLTIVYKAYTPTYEEATNEYGLPIVFEGYENGIVYIDSAVTPTTHIKYTSNNQLATTLSEAEEQNITTQEDINMNVITYMMDIDMILTDMEMSNDISVMAIRRDSSNENMLDRMSDEDKKVYRDNTVVMLEKMITANVLDKEDIEGRVNMYYNKNRISKEQYKYLKSLL